MELVCTPAICGRFLTHGARCRFTKVAAGRVRNEAFAIPAEGGAGPFPMSSRIVLERTSSALVLFLSETPRREIAIGCFLDLSLRAHRSATWKQVRFWGALASLWVRDCREAGRIVEGV